MSRLTIPVFPHDASQTDIDREAARIRASGVLGGPGRMRDLFEYLFARRNDPTPPKEAEIALNLAGPTAQARQGDNSIARVYVHRLRKRLESFYATTGSAEGARLVVPRGEYRLTLEGDPNSLPTAIPPRARSWPAWIWPMQNGAMLVLALLAINALGWMAYTLVSQPQTPAASRMAPWEDYQSSKTPTTIVTGDYYIFGEYEDRLFLRRLIRDFAVNSKQDLVERYMNRPEDIERYGDVALQYLPTSVASALARLVPVIDGAGGIPPRTVLSSEFTPEDLKAGNILYLGLLSSLGPLREPVFAHSRYRFGESYDQIIDQVTGKMHTSEAFLAAPGEDMYRDYALVSTFRGPTGARITVVAGARDTALVGLSDSLTNPDFLRTLAKATGNARDFEALFEVRGQHQTSLETRLVSFAAIDSNEHWASPGSDRAPFPAQ